MQNFYRYKNYQRQKSKKYKIKKIKENSFNEFLSPRISPYLLTREGFLRNLIQESQRKHILYIL